MTERRDEILEIAAGFIERRSLVDFSGIWAKRKRDREDNELRLKVRQQMRDELADDVRGLKTNKNFDTATILQRIAQAADAEHGFLLRDAWPLAWRGLVDIYCTIKCNGNSHPPETSYRIDLTDEGRSYLEKSATAEHCPTRAP